MQPFRTVSSPFFLEMVQAIIDDAGPSYKSPNEHTAGHRLTDEAYRESTEWVAGIIAKCENSCSITFEGDGMTDHGRHPVMNNVALTPHGACHLGIGDLPDLLKDASACAQRFVDKINDTGRPEAFRLVVLVGAMRCTWPHIKAKLPWISCMWCNAHIMSLFFKDVFTDIKSLKGQLELIRFVVKFVRDHQKPLALFRALSAKELKQFASTRYGLAFLVLANFLDCHSPLERPMVDPPYRLWVASASKDNKGDNAKAKKTIQNPPFRKGGIFSLCSWKCLRSSATVQFQRPPPWASVPSLPCRCGVSKKSACPDAPAMLAALRRRGTDLITPLHLAAYAVDPMFNDHNQTTI